MSSRPDPIPIETAIQIVIAAAAPLPPEELPVTEAFGRVLAVDVTAAIALPPFTNSAMDGYAVRAGDTPGRLTVVGESAAGTPFAGTLGPGQAVAISTGAVLPDGADAVVPVEEVRRPAAAAELIEVPATPPAEHVRAAGSDIRRGERVLTAGSRIGAAQLGAAVATGRSTVGVHRRPRAAVLATGSELRPPGEPLGPGQIYDSNGPMLAAGLRSAGALVELIDAAADSPAAHRAALGQALEHDVVITSGGVSVGPHDLVRGIGAELGVQERFWGVAMRPGKPAWFGTRGRTLVFGLPGNPVSALVGFELFVRPALLRMQGAAVTGPAFAAGRLATAVRRRGERDDLIRVRVTSGGLEPLTGQQSHQIAVAAQADGLARIPRGEGELPAGAEVQYLPLAPG